MNEFESHIGRVTRISALVLSVDLVLWILIPGMRGYFAGFLVGGTVSLLNTHYTAWKIRQLTERALANDESNTKRVNLGFMTRASTSLLAVLISLKAADIEFSTTLSGLFLTQLLSLFVGIYVTNIEKRRG
jgi:ATP synthase protein I